MRNSKTIFAAGFILGIVVALAPDPARAAVVRIDIGGPATLNVGDVQQYTATATMDDQSTVDVTQSVFWFSSDESVAVVNSADQPGQVTVVGPGDVAISAYGDDGAVGSMIIVVVDPCGASCSDTAQPNPSSGSDLTPAAQP